MCERMTERIGNCTICGRNAGFNTPKLRSDNGQLVCDTCGDSGLKELNDIVLIGVDQLLDDNGEIVAETHDWETYQLNDIVIWLNKETGKPESAWTDNGRRCFSFSDDEKLLDFCELEWFDFIARRVDESHYRCSGCKKDFEGKPAGYPLFAGVVCPDCNGKHKQHIADQVKQGHICLVCGKPYGYCYC